MTIFFIDSVLIQNLNLKPPHTFPVPLLLDHTTKPMMRDSEVSTIFLMEFFPS